ncbi:MAG: porphobilinogen synthase, partial [Thermacetogeniaceae bacterium]
MMFPELRLRRLRKSRPLREMVQETRLDSSDLIYPLFIQEGNGRRDPVASMPGVFRLSPDLLLEEVDSARQQGILAVLLFGIPESKDEAASSAYDDQGIVQRTVRLLKERWPDLVVITDVCLCEYMSHGHCGVVRDGQIDNDATLPLMAQTALSHARAGADIVAPSDMMD